ncbi:MAG: hypothetical protein VYE77_11100, partial [Planctomycetota bacterium]|nr:hypothetical protein [Planctomycetota bacterium]
MISRVLISVCQFVLPLLLAIQTTETLRGQGCACGQTPTPVVNPRPGTPLTPCANCGTRPTGSTGSAGAIDGQNLNTTLLAHFPPGTPTTYATPPGTLAQPEYCMCTGQYDPQSFAEFAIAAAENGYLFVHTQLPTDSNDNLVGATMDTWFFADPPAIRWRGVKAFRNYVYTVQPTHAGIRRFIIDSKASGANRVTDLGYAHTNQLSWGLQRMHVDEENGHLYVTGYDTVVGGTALCVYDIYNENTDSVIDPPQLVGVWAPGGVIFHSFVHNDRIFLAYQKAGQPNWWQVLDRSSLP